MEFGELGELAVIGLSQDKKLVTVGGRREHRILKVIRDEATGQYVRLESALRIAKNKDSLEKNVLDVKWNPRKFF